MAPIDRVLQLGPWRPDNADFGAGTLQIARGCIRKADGYGPMRSLTPITSTVLPDAAKATRLVVGRDTTSSVSASRTLAFELGEIYEAAGSPLVWTAVGKAGGYITANEDRWYTAQFDNNLYATNFADPVQFAPMSGGDFADTGAVGIPKAKYMAVVRDLHLVLGFIDDPTDGIVTNRIAWSPQEDPLGDWTDIATNADAGQIRNAGPITGLTGGEFGVVLLEDGVSKLLYTGSTPAFQIQTVTDEIGCDYPSSVIRVREMTFFLSRSGWQMYNGFELVPIGQEWTDGWTFDELRTGQEFRISPAYDPDEEVVRWAFVGQGAQSDAPNRILQLKPSLGKEGFTYYDPPQPVICLGEFTSPGFDMDSMDGTYPDLDAITVPFDDPFWAEGVPSSGAILLDGTVGTFKGMPASAQWDWAEGQFATAAQRSKILASLPITDGGAPQTQIGLRNQLNNSVSFSAVAVPEVDGSIPHRDEARYVTMRMLQSGDWESATGLQVSGVTTGSRG